MFRLCRKVIRITEVFKKIVKYEGAHIFSYIACNRLAWYTECQLYH